jgi:hypothetical protein
MAAYFKPTGPEYELVGDDESGPAKLQQPRNRRAHVALASVLFCVVGAAFAVVAPSAPLTSLDEAGAAAGLTLGVSNEYGALSSKKLYPWKHMAEAHKVVVGGRAPTPPSAMPEARRRRHLFSMACGQLLGESCCCARDFLAGAHALRAPIFFTLPTLGTPTQPKTPLTTAVVVSSPSSPHHCRHRSPRLRRRCRLAPLAAPRP